MTWKLPAKAEVDGLVVDANGSDAALRVTQTGTGNALVVEDSANPDSTPFVVNASGNVGIGTNAPGVQLHVSNNTAGAIELLDGAAAANELRFRRYNGTVASPTIVASNDTLGAISFQGYDGSAIRNAAQIAGFVNATPGALDMPGALAFSTTADGASTPTERMRITSAGRVGIGTSSPDALLTVSDASNATTPLTVDSGGGVDSTRGIALNVSGGNYGRILVPSGSGGAMAFWTGTLGAATERMRISSSGVVYFGNGVTAASPATAYLNATSGFGTDIAGASMTYVAGSGTGAGAGGAHLFYTAPAGTTGSTANASVERMRINQAGNVGIGTSSPASKLHVDNGSSAASVRVTGQSSTAQISSYTGVVEIMSTTSDVLYGTTAAGKYTSLWAGGGERMRIDNAGLITGTGTSLGAWTAYTPTITCGTGLNLGTGGSIVGAYVRIGKVVHYRVNVTFGSSGVNPGNSIFEISLPVSATGSRAHGSGVLYDASAGTWRLCIIGPATPTSVNLIIEMAAAAGAYGTTWYNIPWTWAANDSMTFAGTYEAA